MKSNLIDLLHVSMRYDCTDREKRADLDQIFSYMAENDVLACTGTEAGKRSGLPQLMRPIATDYGLKTVTAKGGDSWIAVNKAFVPGRITSFWQKVLDSSSGGGRHTSRGVLGASFLFERFDRAEDITLLTAHYLTHGRPDGTPKYQARLAENKALARAIAAQAKMCGQGRRIVFYGGDQNIVDKRSDTFLGGPLTSAQDELNTYLRSGYGGVDVIASYNYDKRVRAVDVWMPGLRLNTDHRAIEALYDVKAPS